jgi:hypothetical protein
MVGAKSNVWGYWIACVIGWCATDALLLAMAVYENEALSTIAITSSNTDAHFNPCQQGGGWVGMDAFALTIHRLVHQRRLTLSSGFKVLSRESF